MDINNCYFCNRIYFRRINMKKNRTQIIKIICKTLMIDDSKNFRLQNFSIDSISTMYTAIVKNKVQLIQKSSKIFSSDIFISFNRAQRALQEYDD